MPLAARAAFSSSRTSEDSRSSASCMKALRGLMTPGPVGSTPALPAEGVPAFRTTCGSGRLTALHASLACREQRDELVVAHLRRAFDAHHANSFSQLGRGEPGDRIVLDLGDYFLGAVLPRSTEFEGGSFEEAIAPPAVVRRSVSATDVGSRARASDRVRAAGT